MLLKYADPRELLHLLKRRQTDRGRERYRRAGITASTSFLSKALTMLISFVSVPLTIHYLGAERYGVWLTISSLLMWMSLTDFGLTGNALVNRIAAAHGRDDRETAREYAASAFWALILLSGAIGTILLITFHWVPWRALFRVSEAVSTQELHQACALTLAIFVIGLPLSMLNSVYSAYQEGFVWNAWTAGGNLFALLSLVIVTRFQGGLPLLIVAVSGTRALVGVANAYYMFFRHYPFLKPAPSAVRWSCVRSLFTLGFKYMITQLASLGIYQSQPMIITQILGPAQVTIFVIAQKIITLPNDLAYIATAPFVSAFGEAKARGDWAWIRTTFRNSEFLTIGTALVVQTGMVLVAKPIISVWAGAAAVPSLSVVLWLSAYTLIGAAIMPMGQFLCGIERPGVLATSLSICAGVIVILSVSLGHVWGLAGVAAAMALAKLCTAAPIQLHQTRQIFRLEGASPNEEKSPAVA